MDGNLTNIYTPISSNIGLYVTNALLPIVSAVVILLITILLKKWLKEKKRDIWINFLESDKNISECIHQYKRIETPELPEMLKAEVGGIFSSIILYLCFSIIFTIIFGLSWLPFSLSTLAIFLFAFILPLRLSKKIGEIKNEQDLLEYSEPIAGKIIFAYWLTIGGILNALFLNPYIFKWTNPNFPDIHLNSSDMNIFGFSFILLLLSIYFSISNHRDFLAEAKDLLNKQYSKKYLDTFPKVRIKSKSMEIEGKVCDILNNKIIVLEYYGTKKAVEWDSITYMELKG